MLLSVLAALTPGCHEVVRDGVDMCIAEAEREVKIKVYAGCAVDHRHAELSCTLERDSPGSLRLRSRFKDGADPDDSCPGPLVASCASGPLKPGTYTLVYGDDLLDLDVPAPAPPTPPCPPTL